MSDVRRSTAVTPCVELLAVVRMYGKTGDERFGGLPRNPNDMHRPFADYENPDGAMCRNEVRPLSQALTLHSDTVLFILNSIESSRPLAGRKVVVCDDPDRRLEIMHQSFCLHYAPGPSTPSGLCIERIS